MQADKQKSAVTGGQPITFTLNGASMVVQGVSPNMTLLQFLRQNGWTGSKEGCAEGDCGACSVLLLEKDSDRMAWKAVNACLMLLPSVQGRQIITVEGLEADGALHPAQAAMVQTQGSQCGYCTPGFVVSIAEATYRTDLGTDDGRLLADQLAGNLCRCTGYRSIAQAACQVAGTCPKDHLSAAAATAQPNEPRDLSYDCDGARYLQPANFGDLWDAMETHPNHRIIAGATDLGVEVNKRGLQPECWISVEGIAALSSLERNQNEHGVATWDVGSMVRLSTLEMAVHHGLPAISRMLRFFAARQIKNRATLGGNLCNASPIGDMAPVLLALDATLELRSRAGTRQVPIDEFFLAYRKTALAPGEILSRVWVKEPSPSARVFVFKVSKRRELDISAVAVAFVMEMDDADVVRSVRLVFGGMAATTVRAKTVESVLLGQSITPNLIERALAALDQELKPLDDHRGSSWYRRTVASNLLRSYLEGDADEGDSPRVALCRSEGPTLDTKQHVAAGMPDGSPLHQPASHESARGHVTGAARYVADMQLSPQALFVLPVPSPIARGRIVRRDGSAALALPGVAAVLFAADVPGSNLIGPIVHDEPLLAEDEVFFHGQPVALVVAESRELCLVAASLVSVEVEPLPPVYTIDEAIAADDWLTDAHVIARGDVDAALAGAPVRISGELESGGQDHFYLETQSAYAELEEDGSIRILSSTQHPTEVQHMVARALNIGNNQVRCSVPRMGGAFGGKESQATQPAVYAALAAAATGLPAHVWFNRDEDMAWTGKRHPFKSWYEAGFSEDGQLVALKVRLVSDGGWSSDLSGPIMDRALFHLDNAYFVPNLHFEGRAARTNLPSNTAFRGFGGPQGVLVVEEAINRFAELQNRDPAEVRQQNLYGPAPRDLTPYGQPLTENRLERIMGELLKDSDYQARRAEIEAWNRSAGATRRGIAVQPIKFGISFTASLLNQAGALVLVYTDGTIQINHGGTEMGQGLHTKMQAIAAHVFGVPADRVRVMATATDKVPNTSATAASSGSDLNGQAVKRACETIRGRMIAKAAEWAGCGPEAVALLDGQVRAGSETFPFAEVANRCWVEQVSLSSTGYYATPGIEYDPQKGRGKPFFYFAYGAAVAEVEVDGRTGQSQLRRVDVLHDVGDSLIPTLDVGQVEGGFVQGLGWLTTEEVIYDDEGRLVTHAPSTYKIPATGDRPADFRVKLLDRAPQPGVVYGSKAVGEPPFLLAIAVVTALRHAISGFGDGRTPIDLAIPCTAEAILRGVEGQRNK